MDIENDLRQFISSKVLREGAVGLDEPLISSGKVDSFGLLQILGFIEQKYGVTLLMSSDFDNIQTLAGAIRKAGVDSD